MNKKEIEVMIKSSAEKRYEYFIKKVVDFEEVWGLYNEGWATSEDDKGNILVPFWPKSEYAELCAIGDWCGYVPKSIILTDFMKKWLLGMEKDNRRAAIFYTPDDIGVSLDIKRLRNDLNLELEKY